MAFRDVVRMLEADGWQLFIIRGSHRQFRHPTKAATRAMAAEV
jgi:predicted RNA binding protein YcfA (HicA-like mRNA interferase family)